MIGRGEGGGGGGGWGENGKREDWAGREGALGERVAFWDYMRGEGKGGGGQRGVAGGEKGQALKELWRKEGVVGESGVGRRGKRLEKGGGEVGRGCGGSDGGVGGGGSVGGGRDRWEGS